ncbi:MAG: hypothetical protein QSU88_00635, partial [Candidatus Methanoperedens sp.]|nr:hypothetical protein [Candidatus Methanoperedens sp.]
IGALAIPGVGPFIAAGPLMAALAGAGVGGAVGGIVGALAGMGVPEYEAKRYEGLINKGGILLSVHTDSSEWAKRAEEILKSTGAEDISTAGEAKAEETVPPRTVETETVVPPHTVETETVVPPHTVETETVVTETETVKPPHTAKKAPSTEY